LLAANNEQLATNDNQWLAASSLASKQLATSSN
jgi:hypothetical protein